MLNTFIKEAAGESVFLLLDCASDLRMYKRIHKYADVLRMKSLLDDTIDQEALVASAVLVQLNPNYGGDENLSIREFVKSKEANEPIASWFSSTHAFDELYGALQQYLYAQLPSGKAVLYRYYDPRHFPLFVNEIAHAKDSDSGILRGFISAWFVGYKKPQYHQIDKKA